MQLRIALTGNPNCGKTTLFNRLTGSRQYVGNWPGVTVEGKESTLLSNRAVTVIDLPGIYSLSPYTPEERVARHVLLEAQPDVILNLIDATRLERSLYLTTQLIETGLPILLAVNRTELLHRGGGHLDISKLSQRLGCPAMEISALSGTGVEQAIQTAISTAQKQTIPPPCRFSRPIEAVLTQISILLSEVSVRQRRWYAIKLFERETTAAQKLSLSREDTALIEREIRAVEAEQQEESESILANERYDYIEALLRGCYDRVCPDKPTISEKIDRLATGKKTALPVFVCIMLTLYLLSVTWAGGRAAAWIGEGLFGEGWHLFSIGEQDYRAAAEAYRQTLAKAEAFSAAAANAGLTPIEASALIAICHLYDANGQSVGECLVTHADYLAAVAEPPPNPADWGIWLPGLPTLVFNGLEAVNCADWLCDLILDGVLTGIGAVLSFLPQLALLFFCLSFLEECGYMARIAFILDRIFRRFGLSGKSFIPMLIGSGCGVPGILASRTIESEADRRITIVTTTFIPCSAKLPVISLLTGALFDKAWWIAPSTYCAGIAAVLLSGLILKRMGRFSGTTTPFIMELPPYHLPTVTSLFQGTFGRTGDFLKKAGTVILLSSLLIWFAANYGLSAEGFGRVSMENSLLAAAGRGIAPLFRPLGWGFWQTAVATISGLIAKENIVSTLGVLLNQAESSIENAPAAANSLAALLSPLAGYAFLLFNLLCAPCVAAMDAIRRELHSLRLAVFAIGYQCVFAYLSSLCVYQLGAFAMGGGFTFGTLAAILVIIFLLTLLRPTR